jgi:hypothetical protein
MNIVKNMEAIFVAALVVAGFTTFATANERTAAAPTAVKVEPQEKMVTIVVSTKRLTLEEKNRLGS